MKHTPGKWNVDNVFIVSNDDELIAQIDPISEDATSVYMRNPKEARANARLIAAAPELLEACKRVVNEVLGTGEIYWQCKQAIAKAEGNQ